VDLEEFCIKVVKVKNYNALRTGLLLVFLISYLLGIGILCGIIPFINLWILGGAGGLALICFFMSYLFQGK